MDIDLFFVLHLLLVFLLLLMPLTMAVKGASAGGQESASSRSSGQSTRRARKRETDRRAQREHRQRQKDHVRQLEDTVKDSTAQHGHDDRIAALQAGNARLQEYCNALKAKLERIRSIAHVENLVLLDSTDSIDTVKESQIAVLSSNSPSNHQDSESGSRSQQHFQKATSPSVLDQASPLSLFSDRVAFW